MEFKFQREGCQHPREFAGRLLRARVRNQLEDSDLGHIYVGKRRVLRPSHCTTLKLPPPFSRYVFSVIEPWSSEGLLPQAAVLRVFCSGSVFYFGSSTCQQALAPRPHVSEYFSIRLFFFADSKISKWICLFTRIQHVSVSTLVPRTPLGILATEHASWSVQNLRLELWQNQPRN